MPHISNFKMRQQHHPVVAPAVVERILQQLLCWRCHCLCCHNTATNAINFPLNCAPFQPNIEIQQAHRYAMSVLQPLGVPHVRIVSRPTHQFQRTSSLSFAAPHTSSSIDHVNEKLTPILAEVCCCLRLHTMPQRKHSLQTRNWGPPDWLCIVPLRLSQMHSLCRCEELSLCVRWDLKRRSSSSLFTNKAFFHAWRSAITPKKLPPNQQDVGATSMNEP